MKHDWRRLDVTDWRPHYRCSACRQIIVLGGTADGRRFDAALESRGPCYGAFQAALFDGEAVNSLKAVYLQGLWLKARMPKRSPEEVTRLWAGCCESCPERTAERVCGKAKCRVLPCGPPECNMLAWATAKCPIGKFQATFPETSGAEAAADSC